MAININLRLYKKSPKPEVWGIVFVISRSTMGIVGNATNL